MQRIEIHGVDDQTGTMPTHHGRFHLLSLHLTPEAEQRLAALRETVPEREVFFRGWEYNHRDIRLRASGQELQSAAPVFDNLSGQKIFIPIVRDEDAFAAARLVCPALVPDRVLIEGLNSTCGQDDRDLPEQGPGPGYVELSCADVRSMTISSVADQQQRLSDQEGGLFMLWIDLKPAAGQRVSELRETVFLRLAQHRDRKYCHRDIRIRAGGQELQSAAPVFDIFDSNRIALHLSGEKEAFAAARLVCPECVPDQVCIEGRCQSKSDCESP